MQKFKVYREAIDIDYYVYFTKAYFAFNAYLKYKYPDDNDRDKIKKIKENHVIKNKFKNLIFEGKHFRDDLQSLNLALNNAQIENQGEPIAFHKVKINEHYVTDIFRRKFNGVDYFLKSIPAEKFTFTVGTYQSVSFKYEELSTQLEASTLSKTQKEKVQFEIDAFVQQYSVNLIPYLNHLPNFENVGTVEQTDAVEKLYRGIIEITYSLRNGLFHSEVEPNNDVMRVYKYAYFILRKLIKEIPST
ncbi:MAG: hypothetical protein ACOZBX_10795 [Campylobacterota bacterium]